MSVRNADIVIKMLRRAPVEVRAGIGKALAQSVVELDAYAKKNIQGGSRSGRVYRRRSVTHQASAPGQFPKTDRGQLVASLYFRVAADKLSAFFGSKLNYARYLEFGTTRMKPRPWLKPTLKANEATIVARLASAVADALRRAGRG